MDSSRACEFPSASLRLAVPLCAALAYTRVSQRGSSALQHGVRAERRRNAIDDMRIRAYAQLAMDQRARDTSEVDQVLQSVAAYFGLLAEPSRLKVMHSICERERSVGEIVADTGLTQTNVSRQLRHLYARGVLARRKEGSQVFYCVSDDTLIELCRAACLRIARQIDARRPLRKALLKFMPQARGGSQADGRAASRRASGPFGGAPAQRLLD
jgi:DNA-binding transcriptional ArsR family regulator